MNPQEPAYELVVSRIFIAPPPAVRRAFTDPGLRAKWLPPAGGPMQDPTESAEDGSLTWTGQLGPSGGAGNGPGSSARTVRVELRDEPGGKTLLNLRAHPYSEAGEIDARAWWDSAFSHLDTVLEHNDG
jgi:hypothetical protein